MLKGLKLQIQFNFISPQDCTIQNLALHLVYNIIQDKHQPDKILEMKWWDEIGVHWKLGFHTLANWKKDSRKAWILNTSNIRNLSSYVTQDTKVTFIFKFWVYRFTYFLFKIIHVWVYVILKYFYWLFSSFTPTAYLVAITRIAHNPGNITKKLAIAPCLCGPTESSGLEHSIRTDAPQNLINITNMK